MKKFNVLTSNERICYFWYPSWWAKWDMLKAAGYEGREWPPKGRGIEAANGPAKLESVAELARNSLRTTAGK